MECGQHPAGSTGLAWRAQGSGDSLPVHVHSSPLTFQQSDASFHKIQQIQPPGNWSRVTGLVPKGLIKHCPLWEPGPCWSCLTLPRSQDHCLIRFTHLYASPKGDRHHGASSSFRLALWTELGISLANTTGSQFLICNSERAQKMETFFVI